MGATPREARLFQTPELAGVRLASELWAEVLAVAELDNLEEYEPARSQMLFEANFFTAAYVIYNSRRWYSELSLRRIFADALREQFVLLAAVATNSMDDSAFRAGCESLLNRREEEYRLTRASLQMRLLRLFVGGKLPDEVFLTGRIKVAFSQHQLSVAPPALDRFAKRVVTKVHRGTAGFFRTSK
jgi:hypothetical protein